jgi:hypothetical protein
MHELEPCTVRLRGVQVLEGYVRSFDDGLLVLASDHAVRVDEGEDVVVRVLDGVRGECEYAGTIAAATVNGLTLAGVELLGSIQKRTAARVTVSVPCTGTVRLAWAEPHERAGALDAPGLGAAAAGADAQSVGPVDGAEPAGEATEIPVKFTVIDVSAHGMRMMCSTVLPPGSTIRFVFPELSDDFRLEAVVVRAQESRSGNHYGCRFVGTTPRQTDDLFRYVLRTQGAQRRQQMLA